jgi:hypothetical protein
VRKCFPVTKSSTSNVESSTQAPIESTTQSSNVNLTELVEDFEKVQSEIDVWLVFLAGNVTAASQVKETLIATVKEALTSNAISDAEQATLEDLLAFLYGNSTSSSTTANGNRKKRMLGALAKTSTASTSSTTSTTSTTSAQTTTSAPSTPCSDVGAIIQHLHNDIEYGNALTIFLNQTNTKIKNFQSNLSSSGSSEVIVNLTSRMNTLSSQFSQTETILGNVTTRSAQQKTILGLAKSKICALNPAGEKPFFLNFCKNNFLLWFSLGTFIPYDPLTNPDAPVGKAFSAGTYLDNTPAYVGAAYLTNCGNQSYIPGRATTSRNLQGPGVYVVCNEERRETYNVSYLQDNDNLKWVPANQFNASTIPNAIKFKEANSDEFLIGRINLTHVNSTLSFESVVTNYTQVAKIHINNGQGNLFYADRSQNLQLANGEFEILISTPMQLLGNDMKGLSQLIHIFPYDFLEGVSSIFADKAKEWRLAQQEAINSGNAVFGLQDLSEKDSVDFVPFDPKMV